MNKTIVTLVCLASAAALGCGAPDDLDEPAASDGAEVSAPALPIRGEWALVSWKGHVETRIGSIVEEHAVDRRFDARERQGLATFDLDGEGEGTIQGGARCTPRLQEVGGIPRGTAPSRAVTGLYGIVSALLQIVETARCDPSEVRTQTIRVWPRRGFFGGPDPRLDANVGVYGEPRDTRAADRECSALRGARYVTFGAGGVACVGYADGAARTLALLVQRPGQIYVQRLVLRRPGDP